jgi:ankyrin repeat protein
MEDPRYLEYLLLRRREDINIDVQIGNSSWLGDDGLMRERVMTITGCTALNLLFIQTIPRQEKLQLLLDSGASPNIVDHDGFGPIHNLIRNAYCLIETEITNNIHLLLAPRPPMPNHSNNNNADPNLRVQGGDFVGFTPLHIALASRCREYVFDALLEGGADVTLRDNVGRTPLEYARTFTEPIIIDPAILELLWKKGPEFRAMRLHAERVLWRRTHGNRDIYQRILEEGGMHPRRQPPR